MAFSWIPPTTADLKPIVSDIKPREVLYVFDGPVLFDTSSYVAPLLCYKTDEDGEFSQFIAVPTNKNIVERLKEGKLSLRSAIHQPWVWIVAVDGDFRVHKSWSVSTEIIPEELFPEVGRGIYAEHGVVRDQLKMHDASFLSIHFTGNEAVSGVLPFSVIKSLFDEVYGSLWKIFSPGLSVVAPALSQRTLRRALVIPTHEPQFASLLISIEKPRIDLSDFDDKPNIDIPLAQKNIEAAHRDFLKSAATVAEAAMSGKITKGVAQDHFDTIEAVAQLLPSANSFFDTVEINGTTAGQAQSKKSGTSWRINLEAGERIREAYALALRSKRTIRGTVVEVSQRSSSFIVQSAAFRETTCVATSEPVRELVSSLRIGDTVHVNGRFVKRSRRDRLWIDTVSVGDKPAIS